MGRFERKEKNQRVREILDAGFRGVSGEGIPQYHHGRRHRPDQLSKGGFYHYFQSTEQILMPSWRRRPRMRLPGSSRISREPRPNLFRTHGQVMVKRILRKTPEESLRHVFAGDGL
jgi:hypothetical protein